MKRNIFVYLLMAMSTSTAVAAPENNAGTIHFTGQIIEPSCVIVGDEGTTYNVPLGTYPTSYFKAVGTETDAAPVTISLKDCPVKSDGLAAIQLTFSGTTIAGSTDKLAVSEAGGVGIVLSEAGHDETLIKFDASSNQVFIPLPTTAVDVISTSLDARYKSTASTVTAGAANADLTINILYK
ncbi:fimbrial protein [Citrobacter farmeri]